MDVSSGSSAAQLLSLVPPRRPPPRLFHHQLLGLTFWIYLKIANNKIWLFSFYIHIYQPTWTTLRGNSFGYCLVRIYSYVLWPLKLINMVITPYHTISQLLMLESFNNYINTKQHNFLYKIIGVVIVCCQFIGPEFGIYLQVTKKAMYAKDCHTILSSNTYYSCLVIKIHQIF